MFADETEASKVAQIDILPEFYGYNTGKSYALPQIDELFMFNPEEMFFLSVSTLSAEPLKKYSITKDKNIEFMYYTPHKEDLSALKVSLLDNIEKR